jgi:hypothetical protein
MHGWFGFVQRFALAQKNDISANPHQGAVLDLLALFNAPVTRVGKDNFFLVVQCLFHGRVGMIKELLKLMNTQHDLCGKWWQTGFARRRMRCNQREKIRPWAHQVHLIEEFTFTRG